jgi:hypothetical protein
VSIGTPTQRSWTTLINDLFFYLRLSRTLVFEPHKTMTQLARATHNLPFFMHGVGPVHKHKHCDQCMRMKRGHTMNLFQCARCQTAMYCVRVFLYLWLDVGAKRCRSSPKHARQRRGLPTRPDVAKPRWRAMR